jgi:curved DNA-binding protein CbpA
MKDYYKILQIHPEASLEVMNTAYRTLVRQFHPDLYHTHRKAAMNEKMQDINEAYNVLSNNATRVEYDKKYAATATMHPHDSLPARTLSQTLKRMLLWSLGTFVIGRLLLSPLLSNPALRILLLFTVIFGLIRFYSKRKSSF